MSASIQAQIRRYGKYGFRRLMQETRHKLDLENLRPEFEIVPGDPVFRVKCRRCGKVYRLNQSSAHLNHACRHVVADRIAAEIKEGTYWRVKVRCCWRKVEIFRAEPDRGWLVGEYPYFPGMRRWWVRNPERFLRENE